MAQLTILGLGTVGGSLGLALHRYLQSPDGQPAQFTIVGWDPQADLTAAQKAGMIDRGTRDLAAAVREAQIVVIAVPTLRVHAILTEIAPYLPAGATVTDTAPNKRVVLQWAGELLPEGVSFVGGHPLPRRLGAPVVTPDTMVEEPPDADLFQGAAYCIMPARTAGDHAVNQVIGLAEAVGAKPFFTDPAEHDSFQAAIHDLPILTSFALMRVLHTSPSWEDIRPLAAGAFREATRMASGDPGAARADLVANRENLLGWIDRYQAAVAELRDLVAQTDPADLEHGAGATLGTFLTAAADARARWINPAARPSADERAAQATAREMQQSGIMRNLLGGIFTDRFGGSSSRDPRRKDRP